MTSVSIGVWDRMLAGCRNDRCDIQMEAIISAESDDRGGSRPFHASATNGQTYWIKQVDNPQSPRVPVTEHIIAACGRLIGAPVREYCLIEIPKEFDGDRLSNGTVLRKGIAHASLNLEFGYSNKTWGPENRERDDRAFEHSLIRMLREIGHEHQRWNGKRLTEVEPLPKVIQVCFPSIPLGE